VIPRNRTRAAFDPTLLLRTDPAQIPFGGSRDGCFCVCENVRFPPCPVNLFEGERSDSFEDAIDRDRAERNQVRITSHEAHIAAVLHDLNDVACEQCTFAPAAARRRRPMQHRASIEMAAAIDQRHTVPKRKRCSFPKLDTRALAHHPPAIGGMQKYLRVETLGPIDHRRIIMRVRDCNCAEAPARIDFGRGPVVDKGNAIPEQISSG